MKSKIQWVNKDWAGKLDCRGSRVCDSSTHILYARTRRDKEQRVPHSSLFLCSWTGVREYRHGSGFRKSLVVHFLPPIGQCPVFSRCHRTFPRARLRRPHGSTHSTDEVLRRSEGPASLDLTDWSRPEVRWPKPFTRPRARFFDFDETFVGST